uniref:Uncharacterized protein n=1 Tax=viral metagenome TaxID=1070528 RepID=A0A6H1ZG37_9ZZZZ
MVKKEAQILKETLLKNLLSLKREGYSRFFMIQNNHTQKLFHIFKRGVETTVKIIGQKKGRGSAELSMKFETYEHLVRDEFIKEAEKIIKFVNK